jgi:hypothetical protein
MANPTPEWLEFLQQLSPAAQLQVASCRQLDQAPEPEAQWYLLLVPDAALPRLYKFEDVADLRTRLLELEGKDVACFVFYGFRAVITKKPFRYLLLPDGRPLPLFDLPSIRDADESGYLGDPTSDSGGEPAAEEEREEYEEVEEAADEDGWDETDDVADSEPGDS